MYNAHVCSIWASSSRLVSLSVCLICGGCASIVSRVDKDDSADIEDGVIYYMPSRPFKITVTVDDTGNVQTPSVSAGDTIPDRSKRFILHYQRNLLGTNHATIGVNAKGLLESAVSNQTSSATALAQAVGNLAGALHGLAAAAAPAGAPPPSCAPKQSYTKIIFSSELSGGKSIPLCSYTITASLASSPSTMPTSAVSSIRASDYTGQQAGVFYKRDLAYMITMTDTGHSGEQMQWIAYSPDEAPISFLPVTGSLFANSSTNITMSDGAVSTVDQSTDSELVGLVSLPATVISSYFTAVGQIFSSIGNNEQSKNTMLINQQTLAVTQAHLVGCQAALAANDLYGKTGAALTTAIANIKMACSAN